MKALISPTQNNLVAQVENDNDIFEVAEPLYWMSCPDDVQAGWYYEQGVFVNPTPQPVPPTADENKQMAVTLLQQSDWTSIADVSNPEMSNPYLANQNEWIAYRNELRNIAVYPVDGLIPFPEQPSENWVKV
jgi:hypothetical protein